MVQALLAASLPLMWSAPQAGPPPLLPPLQRLQQLQLPPLPLLPPLVGGCFMRSCRCGGT